MKPYKATGPNGEVEIWIDESVTVPTETFIANSDTTESRWSAIWIPEPTASIEREKYDGISSRHS